jgi:hypothetical protein
MRYDGGFGSNLGYGKVVTGYGFSYSSESFRNNSTLVIQNRPAPVAARHEACVCGRSLAGIVSSNPAGHTYVCLLRVLCFVR